MRTAIAPSPTAEATRLIEPERTSPAAKTPGQARLERKRRSVAAGTRGVEVGQLQVLAGQEESVLVRCQRPAHPPRAGIGADEHEQRVVRRSGAGGRRRRVDASSDSSPCSRGPRREVEVDRRMRLDPVQEVARHRRARSARRTTRWTRRAATGKEHGSLTGRVARRPRPRRRCPRTPVPRLRLPRSRRQRPRSPRAGPRRPAIAGSGRNDDRAAAQALAAVELDHVVAVFHRDRRRSRARPAGTEPLGLERGALGEVGAGDPGREAEVVLDPRERAGLAAERRRNRRAPCRDPRMRRRPRRRGLPVRHRRSVRPPPGSVRAEV